jgi:hypothetical protein
MKRIGHVDPGFLLSRTLGIVAMLALFLPAASAHFFVDSGTGGAGHDELGLICVAAPDLAFAGGLGWGIERRSRCSRSATT